MKFNKKELEILIGIIFSDSDSEGDDNFPKRKRRFWVHPYYNGRDNNGAFTSVFGDLRSTGDDLFFAKYMRMSPTEFEDLLQMVGPLIRKETVVREPISASLRLAITLRYLATGESQISLSMTYKCSPRSVNRIIRETTMAITTVLKNLVFPKLNTATYTKIANGFNRRWNFPNCIGAIDGKHVEIKAPPKSGSEYYNYKKTSSIVLLAICDHDYSFIMCDVGAAGRQSDGGVFRNCEFGKKFYSNSLSLPKPCDVAEDLKNAPYLFVADDAFTLTPNMLKPYAKLHLSRKERIFNYRLSRARRIIENSFGILSAKWRIFRTTIEADVSLVEHIILACICLHNWLRDKGTYIEHDLVDKEIDGQTIPGSWRSKESNLKPIISTSNNNSTNSGKSTREKFANYFVGSGAVDWQDNVI